MPQYSASFTPKSKQQDYDLQTIINDASTSGVDEKGNAVPFAGKVDGKRVMVTKVYFRTPRSMWRFFGYYGGLGVVGNMTTYGQFADDSTFELIPTWQNKMQAIMYEDNIFTRTSHYSYELIDNKLRLYPEPGHWDFSDLDSMWVRFYVQDLEVFTSNSGYNDGVEGVNNMNTLPFR